MEVVRVLFDAGVATGTTEAVPWQVRTDGASRAVVPFTTALVPGFELFAACMMQFRTGNVTCKFSLHFERRQNTRPEGTTAPSVHRMQPKTTPSSEHRACLLLLVCMLYHACCGADRSRRSQSATLQMVNALMYCADADARRNAYLALRSPRPQSSGMLWPDSALS